jgi:GT2 family glycosyltransferase
MTCEPHVVTVVLNWNKAQDSANCVAALRHQSYARMSVIVVDNGSTEGSLAPLEALSPQPIILRNKSNLGFAGGVNVGIKRALAEGADYIWLLNNDAVAAPHTLASCVAAMSADPALGLTSPVILNADAGDEVEFCGGLWNDNSFATTNDPATYRIWHRTRPDRLWLVGTALLIRRSVVDAIGLFDEKLFAYWEDNDYSVRALRAGFRCAVVLDGVVRHWSGRPKTDPGAKPVHYHYYMARNEILFIRKHLSLSQQPRPLLWAVHRHVRMIGRLREYPAAIEAIAFGLLDALRGIGGAFRSGRQLPPAIVAALRGVPSRATLGH